MFKLRCLVLTRKIIFRNKISLNILIAKDVACFHSMRGFHRCSSSWKEIKRKANYLIDEDTDSGNDEFITKRQNMYTIRTYTCGELRKENAGQQVQLCGWLEYQRMNKFVVLRDGYGQTQLLFKDNDANQKLIGTIPFESVLRVTGTVSARPQKMVNRNQVTGGIEVVVDAVEVLNLSSETLPFNVREFQRAKESLRMKYRYLDLRFPDMQRNLRTRSAILMRMREFLHNKCGFVDVETPTLFKSTPGGAQEFIVPTQFPGEFYSLVQSPQQFKQMLMAGAIDRYFQIARCYRDETSRPDRQPEFTQLDIEMSFTDRNRVMQLSEDLLRHCWPDFLKPLPSVFPHMKYWDALESFGTDKPDLRIPFKLNDCQRYLSQDFSNVYAFCLVLHDCSHTLIKSIRKEIGNFSLHYGNTKLLMTKTTDVKELKKKLDFLFASKSEDFYNEMGLKNNGLLFIAYGSKLNTLNLLGKLRQYYANVLESLGQNIFENEYKILWLDDIPLFEKIGDTDKLQSAHHPFTAPDVRDLALLNSEPHKVRGSSYDLVLNGHEIAGGSIRIHNATMQRDILRLLDIDTDERADLAHMLTMLDMGCPPHGGIAFGIDRLMSCILNTTSIREVIAFPKSVDGRDHLSGAPSPISDNLKQLYHINGINK